jgi:hypothetical protein
VWLPIVGKRPLNCPDWRPSDNIFDKLRVSDRLGLALYAIHHRLIDQG